MNYEPLRKRVYEILYPEGVPLEFGVEVIFKNENLKEEKGTTLFYAWHDDDTVVFGKETVTSVINGRLETEGGDIVKVIGKPLSLADVLRALMKSDVDFEIAKNISHSKDKQWLLINYGDEGFWIDLSAPNLFAEPENDEACGKVLELLTSN